MIRNLYKSGCTQSRELSWLRFDDRCLNEAKDKHNPLLERLKFVSIYSTNLTEFFRVRVGSLYDTAAANIVKIDNKSGMTPRDQLIEIYRIAKRGCKKQDEIFADLRKKMARSGVIDLDVAACTKSEQKFLRKYFKRQIAPLLAPQIVDSYHPFPNLQSGTTYVTTLLKYRKNTVVGFVPVPDKLPSIIILPDKERLRFVHTDDLIMALIGSVFPDMTPGETMKLTVARSAYVDVEDEAFDDIIDFRKKMLKVLKERRKMNVIRLVCSKKPSTGFRKYLFDHLNINQQMLFVCATPANMKYAFSLSSYLTPQMKEKLCFPEYTPKLYPGLNYSENLFSQIRKKDVLLSYPYEAMEPFLLLLKESAVDPAVVSIKITLYRIATNARLIEYLCLAAENGKEVDVLIELKARFDEQNNIDYSEQLEDAGCNLTYGFDNVKVHAKVCLITRMEKNRPASIALIATGNFNENTARQYTDMAYLTGKSAIVNDVVTFFQNMWIGKLDGEYEHLMVAPAGLKAGLIKLIDEEIAKKENGRIFLKLNAITDEELIGKLIEASSAGVKITMMVRGICCLLPMVKGKTENVEIRSVVGRYLEHSRIYVFGQGKQEKMFISSADFMTRNTERRVEIACPINDASVRRKIRGYIDVMAADNVKTRFLYPNGRLHKVITEEPEFIGQDHLMSATRESRQRIRPSRPEKTVTVFHGELKTKKKKKKK